MFSLTCAWINVWVNNREAVDLRRRRAHYEVTVIGGGGGEEVYESLVNSTYKNDSNVGLWWFFVICLNKWIKKPSAYSDSRLKDENVIEMT